MLSGRSETGTEHEDPISFASELKLGTNSPTIELRNDADPSQEPLEYALALALALTQTLTLTLTLITLTLTRCPSAWRAVRHLTGTARAAARSPW